MRSFLRAIIFASSLDRMDQRSLFGFFVCCCRTSLVLVLGAKCASSARFPGPYHLGFGQLLLQSTMWLFVSRGQSARLLRLMLIISPISVGSYMIGLPFGIRWVALSLSLVLLAILPWILNSAFVGRVTLRRLGRALL